MATAPFEIIAAPFDVYVAPVGTAFLDIGASLPAGAWTLLGTSGKLSYDEDGIKVTHDQTIVEFRPVGSTGARKAFRTEESCIIEFNIADVSAATYAKVLNGATVTTTANGGGNAGSLNIPLKQGLSVNLYAMILRGLESPAGNAWVSQYQVPIVYQNANPEPTYKKGDPAMLKTEWRVLEDATLGFGKYLTQNAAVA